MSLLNFNEFKWRAMTAAINQMYPAPRMLQDMVFKRAMPTASEYIDVDVKIGGKMLLPFVSSEAGGTVVSKLGRKMLSVKAPRLRPKKPFTATELLTERPAGSAFYGATAGGIQQHRQQKIGEELADLKNRVDWTIEKMCADALTGTMTCNQDDVQFAIDYQMPNANKPTLDTKWNATGADILGDIDTLAEIIIDALGMAPDIAICGKNTAKSIMNDTAVKAEFDNRRMGGNQSLSWDVGNTYLGNIRGIKHYKYGTKYTDLDGNPQNLIPDDAYFLIWTGARLSIEFGMINDLDAEAKVVAEYFSKSWVQKDPSALWLLAESRPLPVPWQPDAIVYVADTQE